MNQETDEIVVPCEPKVHLVKIRLCELCLRGDGQECHTPGCALWLHNSPGMPVHPEMYEIVEGDV